MPLLSDNPACRYQHSLSRYITCQDVCVQKLRDKTPNIVTWSEHFKICCHVIITR